MWSKLFPPSKTFLLVILVWLTAIGIRIYGVLTPAQLYDIATFQAWGAHMLAVGPVNFYTGTWSDYLPLPLYSFAPILALSTWLHLSFGLVFKSVLSALELILIGFIYRAWRGKKRRLLLLVLLTLSPVLIGDNAFWGQVDTIPALLSVLSFLTLSPVLFGLAVAIKPIMILVAPVLWILAIKRGKWWQFPVFSALTFLATGVPMVGFKTFTLLWARTIEQVGTYPYTTINAWNVWSIVPHPGSWLPDNQVIFSLSAHSTGLILFSIFALLTLNNWRKSKWDAKFGLRVAATLLLIFYTFTTRMHERHLLFGLPFLALAAITEPWLIFPFIFYSLFFILNLYSAFYWVNHAQTWPFEPWISVVCSWGITLLSLGLSTIWDWPKFLKNSFKVLKSNKLLILILIISAFLRLYNLAFPSTYIFDEVYHAFTSREFLHNHVEAWEWWTTPPAGVAYEWTHPPVAKYGMVTGMLLFGENSFGWRVGSAVFGVASILGLYLLVLALTKNKTTALISAFLASIEGLHISQSRIAMNDIYMLAFFIWSLYAAVKSRWKLTAVLYGLSLASKWSALYGIVPLGIIFLHDDFSLRKIFSVIRLLLIVICVYLLTFTPFILAGHTWSQLVELHRQMWYYHTHLVATHAYQSAPLQWIFVVRPVWYYVNYGKDVISNIYAQGNPFILWLGLVALILQLKNIFKFPYFILYTSYLIFTLPWLFSPRIMFFYHYLPSATFLCVILASYLSSLSSRSRNITLTLCLFGLLVISPMLYGFPMPHIYWDTLFKIFPSWK